ncbi:MAG: AraC family transcriptional regulator [Planctomycetota bacterium]
MPTTTGSLHRSPIRIIAGGSYGLPRGGRTPAHRHACWELVCYRTGRVRITVDGAPTDLGPGSLWLTPPGHVHSEEATTAFSNWYLLIEAPVATPWPLLAVDDAEGAVTRLCGAIVREHSGNASDKTAILACLAGELDLRLRRAVRQRRDRTAALVIEAEAIFAGEPTHPLPIGRLAIRLGVAPSTLRAAFQARRGCSPSVAMAGLRAGHASGLLASTTLTLEQIAERCGYHSASHLSRWIRRLHGCTPGKMRRRGSTRDASP